MRSQDCDTQSGFTLVEVVLAIGIVGIGLLSIIGAFSSLQSSAHDYQTRREAAYAINSLQNYLQNEEEFSSIYREVKADGLDLVFLSYRGNEPGQPSASGQRSYGHWARADSNWGDEYEPARNGSIFLGTIELDEDVNPATKSELEAEASSYPHGLLALKISLFEIFNANQVGSIEGRRPFFTSTVIKNR